MGDTLAVPMEMVHELMFMLDYYSTPGDPSETLMRQAGAIHGQLRDLMSTTVDGRDGWLDISTATKDETVIIGWHRLWVYPFTIYWCTGDGCWKRSQDETTVEIVPTHWMPLPKPPQADARRKGGG